MSDQINANNLRLSISTKSILHDINFTLKKGEVLGVIGPNGAGKTSLLRCLHGENSHFIGDLKLKNKAICDYNRRELACCVAVVSQHQSSSFNLSVLNIVKMGLVPHKTLFEADTGADQLAIKKALYVVGLSGYEARLFESLSGGEQQRTYIARALVQQADILVMDEPSNHLDVYYQHQILSLIKNLGLSVVVSMHDLNLAARYCDSLLLLNKGQQVCHDRVAKVLVPSILEPVFRMSCHIDSDPIALTPRVSFGFQDESLIQGKLS